MDDSPYALRSDQIDLLIGLLLIAYRTDGLTYDLRGTNYILRISSVLQFTGEIKGSFELAPLLKRDEGSQTYR